MDETVQFRDAFVDNEYIFFSAEKFNGLFRVKIGGSEAEFLGHFPGEVMWQDAIHGRVLAMSGRLYFLPFKGKGIGIYDLLFQEISSIQLEEKEDSIITNFFVIGTDIYLISFKLEDPFYVFHTTTNTYEVAEDLWKKVQAQCSSYDEVCFSAHAVCVQNNKLYLTVNNRNVIIEVDLRNEQVSQFTLPVDYKCRNMLVNGEIFYFTLTDQCKIIRWNLRTRKCCEYIISEKTNSVWCPYAAVVYWRGHFFVLSDREEGIWELDEKRKIGEKKPEYMPETFKRTESSKSLFWGYQHNKEMLFLFPNAGNGTVLMTKKGSMLFKVRYSNEAVDIIREYRKQYVDYQVLEGNVIEEKKIKVGLFLSAVFEETGNRKNKGGKSIGKGIWETGK